MERNVWEHMTRTATGNEERSENQWPLDANDEYLHGNKYKALIHERDFEGGKLIEINIQNCVDKSYKTFILLTPCFMNSKWSRHEASLAQMQEKAVFIRLKLDTEQEQELQEHLERDENKPIKHNLKTRTYLIWSGEKDDRRFWNQVAYLLEGGYSGYSGFFDGFKDTSSRVFRKLKQIFFSKEKEIVRHPRAMSIPGPTPEPTPNQPEPTPEPNEDWFHPDFGSIKKARKAMHLRLELEGTYMVTNVGEDDCALGLQNGSYALLRGGKTTVDVRIIEILYVKDDQKFQLFESNDKFSSVPELIQHFQDNFLPQTPKYPDPQKLGNPLPPCGTTSNRCRRCSSKDSA